MIRIIQSFFFLNWVAPQCTDHPSIGPIITTKLRALISFIVFPSGLCNIVYILPNIGSDRHTKCVYKYNKHKCKSFFIKGGIERDKGHAMKGKALLVEFAEGQVEDLFYNGDSERGNNINSATNSLSLSSSFVQIGSLSKPVVLPPPPSPGLNPSTAQLLFRKELKLSDVGQARRIVIPKALAEKYLPCLTDGDGIFIYMDDMNGARVWVFRYRYWQNNNSRMFVLEKTGDFVKAHGLQAGDIVLIYKDEHTGRYGIQAKKGEIKQKIPNDDANVPMTCYGNFFHGNEIGTYACPEYNNNMQNFMMNFLGGPELTVPNVEQSMSFDPTNVYPHYYF